jgi:hypothetical protein
VVIFFIQFLQIVDFELLVALLDHWDARRYLCVIGRRLPTPIAFREMISVGGSCCRLNSLAGDSTMLRIR